MANTKLDIDKIFNLVMICRQSGMSDRQWCNEQDINPSTPYYWIKKLRDHACYDIPKNSYHLNNNSSTYVVKVDFPPSEPPSYEKQIEPVNKYTCYYPVSTSKYPNPR